VPDNVRDSRFKPAGRKVPQKTYRPAVVAGTQGFKRKRAERALVASPNPRRVARLARILRSANCALLRMTMPLRAGNDGGVRVKRCGKSAPPRQ